MKFFKKNVEIPVSNDTQLIEAVQLWEVRWRSRHGQFNSDTRDEIEAFPSEVEAQRFAEALRNAFRLIRHSSGDSVKVTKSLSLARRIAEKRNAHG